MPMRFTDRMREALEALGLHSTHYASQFQNWGSHHGTECGLDDSLIKALGRWESTAILVYVRTPCERSAVVLKLVFRQ